jgi:transposase InsO family protein
LDAISQPVHQRAVPAADGRSWRHLLDEPVGRLLEQCGDGKLFSSPKTERTARTTYRTRDEARADVFDYVERFYNPERRHSTIGYMSTNGL